MPMKPKVIRFDARIYVRCPASLPAVVERAANRQLTSPAEYVRRAVIERLSADGFDPGSA